MKKTILGAIALTAILSCSACGKDVGKSDESPLAPVTTTNEEVSAAVTTTASKTNEKTTTTTSDEESETTTTAEEVTENTTTADAAPAGGGESSVQQSSPAHSHDSVSSPNDYNYGPAPAQYNIDGLTYIQGVLIANKSYSLPADFNPGIDPTCQSQFNKLQSDASAQGLNIWFASGFRSYDYQSQIYNNYVARDGQAAADTFSARPGHSEHQTGLAIDVNQIDDSFIGTPEAIWLENHCHEYGFILRYPQGKQDITGYKYESWHIRYVGTDMSYAIHNSGLTLEEYFGIDSYYH